METMPCIEEHIPENKLLRGETVSASAIPKSLPTFS